MMHMRLTGPLLVASIAAGVANSQSVQLVKDINPQPVQTMSSNPRLFAAFGTAACFTANDGLLYLYSESSSVGLLSWIGGSSTRPVGELVVVIVPGVITGRVFYTSGNSLYRNDLNPMSVTGVATFASPPQQLTVVGSTVFFTADDGTSGVELWKVTGVVPVATRVSDIRPGPTGSSPTELVAAGTSVFFAADDGTSGNELWVSDGTASGTRMVKDIRGGAIGSYPRELMARFDAATSRWLVYFAAVDNAATGVEPWVSDGGSYTVRLANINPTPYFGSFPASFTLDPASSAVYFAASNPTTGRELYYTDGTISNTRLVVDIRPGPSDALAMTPSMVVDESILFFPADDGVRGVELWQSRGSASTTSLVVDIGNGSSSSMPRQFVAPAVSTQLVLFTVDVGPGASSLWVTDGTSTGTAPLAPAVQPGPGVAIGASVLFAAEDNPHGREPWISKGSSWTTEMLADLNPTPAGPETLDSNPLAWEPGFLQDFYLSADDGSTGRELWTTDGTELGTRRVADLVAGSAGSFPVSITAAGRRVWFTTRDGYLTASLWVLDDPVSAPRLLAAGLVDATGFTAVGERLFFSESNPTHGAELMVADASTPGGPLRIELQPGAAGGRPSEFAAFRGRLYFAGDDGRGGRELWCSDGTPLGTIRISDIAPGNASANPRELTVVGDTLFFAAEDQPGNLELWKSDGTPGSALLVAEIRPGPAGSSPLYLTAVGDTLFFAAVATQQGTYKLWKSDGTAAGTVRLSDASPLSMCAMGDLLVFEGTDYVTGWEPWRSDGTVAGTYQLRDIYPGATGSAPRKWLSTGSRYAWFEAEDGVVGRELWRTDGTRAGTVLVADLSPGASHSSPTPLGIVHGKLLLAAKDPVVGRELFALDPGASAWSFGHGSSAAGDVAPILRMDELVLGSTSILRGAASRTGTSALVLLSTLPATPFHLGGGQLLYVDPLYLAVVGPFPVANGRWSLPIRLGVQPSWIGLELAFQAALVPSPAWSGLDLTNGMITAIGW